MKYPDDFIDKVICGDCLEVMKEIPDKSVDLVLTDPPYEKPNEWLSELFRISKGKLAIIPGQENIRFYPQEDWIIAWLKPNAMHHVRGGMLSCWGAVLIYGLERKMFFKDLIYAVTGQEKSIEGHPYPKPLNLFADLINRMSNENDIVLDPFLGSGTTAVACKQLNRHFIGIEINPDYCKIARERLMGVPDSLFKNVK